MRAEDDDACEEPEGPFSNGEITQLLQAASGGETTSLNRLFTLLYRELRSIARRQLGRASSAETLSTTALVHETYLKLSRNAGWTSRDRGHFFALAARAMRQILIDHARARLRERRGGGAMPITLDDVDVEVASRPSSLIALDEALDRLEVVDEELARLVEQRFFAGLSLEEISGISGRSVRTLKRYWQTARAFLVQQMAEQGFTR